MSGPVPLPPVPLPDAVADLAHEHLAGRRPTAEPRDAATVVLLRPGPAGAPEAYLLARQTSMAFAGGMCVFPGGGVDPRDAETGVEDAGRWAGPTPQEWAQRLGTDAAGARALVCAAVRETFEESGVLLAGPRRAGSGVPDGAPPPVLADTTGEAWEADRRALESRTLALTALLEQRDLVLRTDLLGVWDAWTTPVFEARRYRTWFFTAVLPAGQTTRDVSSESSSVRWVDAAHAARQAETGEVAMMPPTYLTCLEIGSYADLDAVVAEAARRSVTMFTPEPEPLPGGGWTLSVPDRQRPLLAHRTGGPANAAGTVGS